MLWCTRGVKVWGGGGLKPEGFSLSGSSTNQKPFIFHEYGRSHSAAMETCSSEIAPISSGFQTAVCPTDANTTAPCLPPLYPHSYRNPIAINQSDVSSDCPAAKNSICNNASCPRAAFSMDKCLAFAEPNYFRQTIVAEWLFDKYFSLPLIHGSMCQHLYAGKWVTWRSAKMPTSPD